MQHQLCKLCKQVHTKPAGTGALAASSVFAKNIVECDLVILPVDDKRSNRRCQVVYGLSFVLRRTKLIKSDKQLPACGPSLVESGHAQDVLRSSDHSDLQFKCFRFRAAPRVSEHICPVTGGEVSTVSQS